MQSVWLPQVLALQLQVRPGQERTTTVQVPRVAADLRVLRDGGAAYVLLQRLRALSLIATSGTSIAAQSTMPAAERWILYVLLSACSSGGAEQRSPAAERWILYGLLSACSSGGAEQRSPLVCYPESLQLLT